MIVFALVMAVGYGGIAAMTPAIAAASFGIEDWASCWDSCSPRLEYRAWSGRRSPECWWIPRMIFAGPAIVAGVGAVIALGAVVPLGAKEAGMTQNQKHGPQIRNLAADQ
jgi:hypothetical protein